MGSNSISEDLMFNTIRLKTKNGSLGTGFFFNFLIDDSIIPAIITNKHVINNNPKEDVTFFLHLKEKNKSTEENFQVNYCTDWIFHPTQDLCMAFANPMFEKVKDLTKKDVFFKAINEGFVYNESQLKELRALEEVVMVGYPIGLWDKNNNLPIFRTGSTASHPAYDFNEKGIGLVDMACFPGSSGSPIYIMNEISYIDKKGTIHMGSSRLIFLGILYSGASLDAKGEILVESIPTQQTIFSKTKLMTNLGYYIKAHELSEFRETIKQKLNSVIRKE